jgi:hypothetical protein
MNTLKTLLVALVVVVTASAAPTMANDPKEPGKIAQAFSYCKETITSGASAVSGTVKAWTPGFVKSTMGTLTDHKYKTAAVLATLVVAAAAYGIYKYGVYPSISSVDSSDEDETNEDSVN